MHPHGLPEQPKAPVLQVLGLAVPGVVVGGLLALIVAPHPRLPAGVIALVLAIAVAVLVWVLVLTRTGEEPAFRPRPPQDRVLGPGRSDPPPPVTDAGSTESAAANGLSTIRNPALPDRGPSEPSANPPSGASLERMPTGNPGEAMSTTPPPTTPVPVIPPVRPAPPEPATIAPPRPTHVVVGEWWKGPAAGRRAAAAPGLELEDADQPTQIASCPRCNGFELDVTGRGSRYDFTCRRCSHTWSWQAGEDWPPVRTDHTS